MKRLLLIMVMMVGLLIRLGISTRETPRERKLNQVRMWEKLYSKNILFISGSRQLLWSR